MGSVIGAITGSNDASGAAISAQTNAANQSNQTQKEIYDQNRADNEQYRAAGNTAIQGMQDPSFNKTFSASDYQQSPGYQFQMDEGQKALERSAAAKGGLQTGGTLKALTQYSQGLANQDYQQAYNNFNNDQSNRFGRLSTIAGLGQNANNSNQQSAMNYGNNVSQTQQGLGNAVASANIAKSNQNANLLGQAAGTAALMFSDARLKKNVEAIDKKDLAELRSHLKAVKFNYTHNYFGEGDFYGVMAQDLEKSKLGRTCVVEDEFGNKMINPKKAMSLFLAVMAEA